MREKRPLASAIFLALLTGLALWMNYLMVKPFLATILLAVVLAILADPVYRRLLKRFKGREVPASAAACMVVILIILLPVFVLLSVLTVESVSLYHRVADFVQEGGVSRMLSHPLVTSARGFLERVLSNLGGQPVDLHAKTVQVVQALSGYFIALGQKAASNIASGVGLFFLLVFALFFIFIDQERMTRYLTDVSPLPAARSERLMRRFVEVTRASFTGTFGVAAAQGILGGVALSLVGYQGIFWGFIMIFCSLIPMVGAAIIWIPAAAILLLSGRWMAGVFVLVWGVGVVSTVDNFLRPWLMKGHSGLHTLVVLFSVLGGIKQFGALGIVFGPLVAGLGLTLLDMFREEFGAGRQED